MKKITLKVLIECECQSDISLDGIEFLTNESVKRFLFVNSKSEIKVLDVHTDPYLTEKNEKFN